MLAEDQLEVDYRYPQPNRIVTLEQNYKAPKKIILSLPQLKVRLAFTRKGDVTVATITSASWLSHKDGWKRGGISGVSAVSYRNPEDEPSAFVGDRVAAKRVLDAIVSVDEILPETARLLYSIFRREQRKLAGWRGVES